MAVPTQLSDLSATAASNSPTGTDTVGTTMDDFLRAHASIIARISAGTDALATPNVGAATGTSLVLSGLATVNGAFTSLGLDDNATAKALTLSGSGANSVTISNSATNPTLGVTGGSLAVTANIVSTGEIQAQSGTSTPAGGEAAIYMGTAGFSIGFGSGVPTYAASKGSLYLRSDGTTTNDRMYLCITSNVAAAGSWTAVITAA